MLDLNEVRRQSNNRDQLAKWNGEGRLDVDRGRLSVEINLPRRFDASFIRTQSEWMASAHQEDLYLWFHVDETGDPFYAGRGRGTTAWDRHGGVAWEWFVRERLGGSYQVAILATGLTEEHSSALLEQVMEAYGMFLLNQSNMHRGMDYAALDAYHKTKAQIRPLYDLVSKAAPHQRLALALQAQRLQYQLSGRSNETGRFGEVLDAMGAIQTVDQFFIHHIVEGLMEAGQVDEARFALAEYLQHAPRLAEARKIQRLQKIVDRGTFRRRTPRTT